jgi:hypothetical protein
VKRILKHDEDGNLNISLFFCLPRKIGITVSCLGFPGKGAEQVERCPAFSEFSYLIDPFCLRRFKTSPFAQYLHQTVRGRRINPRNAQFRPYFNEITSCLRMIHAIDQIEYLGMLSIQIEKTERPIGS